MVNILNHRLPSLCITTKKCTLHKQFIRILPVYTRNNSTVPPQSSRWSSTWRYTSILKSRDIIPYMIFKRNNKFKALDVDTNVANNVYLYKFDGETWFRRMHYFAIFQLAGSIIVAWALLKVIQPKIDRNKPLWDQLMDGTNFLVLVTALFALALGPLVYSVIWLFSVRTVKNIILHKGGEKITLITFSPWKKNAKLTVPVDMIQTRNDRTKKTIYLPLKVRGKPFYYIVETKGQFLNTPLFDHTIGVMKNW